jgi:hypothetical protein
VGSDDKLADRRSCDRRGTEVGFHEDAVGTHTIGKADGGSARIVRSPSRTSIRS